jgi:dipeptidyl aminopeptidase/acylaminoacyl peptidase
MGGRKKVALVFIVVFLCSHHTPAMAQESSKRPFTVLDEIDLTAFVYHKEVRFSPDGNYFAVNTERGRLELNCVEDSLRFYRSEDVEGFLSHSDQAPPPSPVWVVNRCNKKGSVISNWRWLADSSGVAFLERMAGRRQHLVLADLHKKEIEPLTPESEQVEAFDIRDRQHYVYIAVAQPEKEMSQGEEQPAMTVGTGRSLPELLFPNDPARSPSHKTFWAVIENKRFEVKTNGAPLLPEGDFSLSPDGQFMLTLLKVPEVPLFWKTLYPPPFASSPFGIHAGRRDIDVYQYVLINLQKGSVRALTDGPISNSAGWFASSLASPDWSSDDQSVLLPGAFPNPKEGAERRPCVLVVDLRSYGSTCVEMLKGNTETGVEQGFHRIFRSYFVNGDRSRVRIAFLNPDWAIGGTVEYMSSADGAWQVIRQTKDMFESGRSGLEINVKQSIKEPPLLIAAKNGRSRTLWDANPQLQEIELGQASVYSWKDKEGREWKGGLYKPSSYKVGQRYPLVIQTHGFEESEFKGTASLPPFAARALAAAGIMVLQVNERCLMIDTPDEGPCAVSRYESAVQHLVSEGVVDRERVGIIGFSRTCFYVMETLTIGSVPLKAASVQDGGMVGYSAHLLFERVRQEEDLMMGAQPFGAGLQQWLKRSPSFNLDRITAPLLVVAHTYDGGGVLSMWEPYAGLHLLHKPVDLIILNTDEHVVTNPAISLASQGGSVDWFRFWLQDYEDPDPAKVSQYKRWRGLRELQAENEKKTAAVPSASNLQVLH